MALLRFIYRTLPNFAGKLLKTPSKEEKQEKGTKRAGRAERLIYSPSIRLQFAVASDINKQEQKGSFTRHYLAPNSQWRVIKNQQGQKQSFNRHGEYIYLRGEPGRINSSKMTWHKPTGEETSTRHGE